MANPLIPQKRADKNNRLVTRYVKPSSVKVKAPAMPAPALAQQFRIPPQDVKKPRRAGTTKSDVYDASVIRQALSIPNDQISTGSVDMSDNEIYAYMKLGFRMTHAVEFKRYGADPESARYVGLPRGMSGIKAVEIMQGLGMPPEAAARVRRHGISDSMLGKYLSDEELVNLLYKENLNSTKHRSRAVAASYLIQGKVTPEDAAELGMEALGTYGMFLKQRRDEGLPIDYEVIRSAIVRSEEPYVALPEQRRGEGWSYLDHKIPLNQIMNLVDRHGPEVLESKYLAVYRMDMRFGGEPEGYQYMDRFFALAEGRSFELSDRQIEGLWRAHPKKGRKVADFVEVLRNDGLTPPQVIHSLSNGLTLEQAHQVHLNDLPASLIEGWL